MSRDVTLLGYVVLAAAIVAYQVTGLVTRRVPTLGGFVRLVFRSSVGRWVMTTAWLWLGWHVFVRAHLG